ncbi:MAG: ribonuclease III [Chitinophagales bacterium]
MIFFRKLYNLYFSPKKQFVQKLRPLLGYTPCNIKVYRLAFNHKSKHKMSNERLEFLGDTILDSIISDVLYRFFPNKNEGELSKIRSKIVSRDSLNNIAKKLNLLEFLDYRTSNPHHKSNNMLGNTLEALIGAIYLDGGYDLAAYFIKKQLLKKHINWATLDKAIVDFKSVLYDYVQKNAMPIRFEVVRESKRKNEPLFEVAVYINDENVAKGIGRNKKAAEQDASKNYLEENNLID